MTTGAEHIDAETLFATTVPESHAKFVAACEGAGLDVTPHRHPLVGPTGEALHAAVARMGPCNARNVVLSISGVHGIEGFAGSALKIGALQARAELLPLAPDMAVVFVHQLNPWGAAWSRKENEHNQELLRHTYHQYRPRRPNPVFAALAEVMDYPSLRTLDEFMTARRRVRALSDRFTPQQIGKGLVPGQDTHPTLFTFNGGPKSWSTQLLEQVVKDELRGAERVVVFDLHTAVGPWGETVIMEESPDDSPKHRRVESWCGALWPWGEGTQFYEWIADFVPGVDVTGITLECGTQQLGDRDQYIFALESWLHHYGDRNAPEAAEYLQRFRDIFYPATPDWMRAVWAHGARRWRQIVGGLRDWAVEA